MSTRVTPVVGATWTYRLTFRDGAGQPIDPDVVRFWATNRLGQTSWFRWPAQAGTTTLERVSAGDFRAHLPLSLDGRWRWRVEGTRSGGVPAAWAAHGELHVADRHVPAWNPPPG